MKTGMDSSTSAACKGSDAAWLLAVTSCSIYIYIYIYIYTYICDRSNVHHHTGADRLQSDDHRSTDTWPGYSQRADWLVPPFVTTDVWPSARCRSDEPAMLAKHPLC